MEELPLIMERDMRGVVVDIRGVVVDNGGGYERSCR